ncbi:hypothetical protein Tco_1515905 [Tanacetum coccineum]
MSIRMSNKKRSLKRQIKVSVRFNDHVVGNLSQKRNDDCVEENNEQIRVSVEGPIGIIRGNEKEKVGTYANAVKKVNDHIQNKLSFVPTVVKDLGNEVVVFDEEQVEIGSKKWQLTLCGYFVGHKMSLPEASTERLSAMDSSVGKPIIMDYMIANVCNNEVGRIEYTRILIEVSDEKGFKDSVELHLMQCNKRERTTEEITEALKSNTYENTKGGVSVEVVRKNFLSCLLEMIRKKAVDGTHNKERHKNKFSVLPDVESDHMEEKNDEGQNDCSSVP